MKIAALVHAIEAYNESIDAERLEPEALDAAHSGRKRIEYRLVHTGQHYDKNMSDTFFEELGIPAPDVNLGCGGGTQAEQTAAIMMAYEKELMAHPTDVVLVVGDVTSTMACSIVAKKLNTRVCHVEAGIRSWDLTMPEEINRMVTDSLADYMFTTSEVANENLLRMGAELIENKNKENTHSLRKQTKTVQQVWFVGNVMIDTLLVNRTRFRKPEVWDTLKLQDKQYIVMTMHRPANVDEENHLRALMEQIITNVEGLPIVFPIHPRTAKIFYNLWKPTSDSSPEGRGECESSAEVLAAQFPNLHIVEPMGYLEFNYLVERAKAVVTDSGGITEETTVMGVPCITLRDNPERPETCTIGTNELIGTNPDAVAPALKKLFAGEWKKGAIPPLWDGHAAERIIAILAEL